MTRLFACLLILLLGGCGMAVSEKPMFAAADTVGAPQFENGVWLMDVNDDCRVDAAAPVSRWPGCADWAVHRDGQWFERDGERGIAIKPLTTPMLVVGGDIALVQTEFRPEEGPDNAPTYLFMAFDNRERDIVRRRSITLWNVMCGTYPEGTKPADDGSSDGIVRFPGFDEECRPASQQVLRDAAAASRPADAKLARLQWARDRLN